VLNLLVALAVADTSSFGALSCGRLLQRYPEKSHMIESLASAIELCSNLIDRILRIPNLDLNITLADEHVPISELTKVGIAQKLCFSLICNRDSCTMHSL
jgi:hypothetical protein